MMEIAAESALLRIYCCAGDTIDGRPLHEALVQAGREGGLAGASVVAGTMGYGRSGRIYSDLLSDSEAESQPLVVEFVDQPTRIQAILPALRPLFGDRLVTLERAEVMVHRRDEG